MCLRLLDRSKKNKSIQIELCSQQKMVIRKINSLLCFFFIKSSRYIIYISKCFVYPTYWNWYYVTTHGCVDKIEHYEWFDQKVHCISIAKIFLNEIQSILMRRTIDESVEFRSQTLDLTQLFSTGIIFDFILEGITTWYVELLEKHRHMCFYLLQNYRSTFISLVFKLYQRFDARFSSRDIPLF